MPRSRTSTGRLAYQIPVSGGGGGAPGSTWNPLDKSANITLANGNIDATATAIGFNCVRGTAGKASGAFYFEVKLVSVGAGDGDCLCGIGDTTTAAATAGYPGLSPNGAGTRMDFSAVNGFVEDVGTAFGAINTLVNGDYYMFAVDIDNKKIWRGVKGVWLGGVTPVVNAATQWAHWVPALTVFPWAGVDATGGTPTVELCPTITSFQGSAPSGFTAWG